MKTAKNICIVRLHDDDELVSVLPFMWEVYKFSFEEGKTFDRVVLPLTVRDESYQGKNFPGMLAYCTKRKEARMFNVVRILELKEA